MVLLIFIYERKKLNATTNHLFYMLLRNEEAVCLPKI